MLLHTYMVIRLEELILHLWRLCILVYLYLHLTVILIDTLLKRWRNTLAEKMN